MTKPIRPEEVEKEKGRRIPDRVIEVVNELIVKEFRGKSATVRQDTIVQGIVNAMGCDRAEVFENHWLDFESRFQEAGWIVKYDKPAYNENYPATFEFRVR